MLRLASSRTSACTSSALSFFCLLAFFALFAFFPFLIAFFVGAACSSEVLLTSLCVPLLPGTSPSGTRALIGVWGKGVEAAISVSSCCSKRSAARVTRGMVVSYTKARTLNLQNGISRFHRNLKYFFSVMQRYCWRV